MYDSERTKAMIKESEQRCLQIEKRISSINFEKQNMNKQLDNFQYEADQNKTIMNNESSKIIVLKRELEDINNEIDTLTKRTTIYAKVSNKLKYRYSRLSQIKNDLDISFARLEEKVKANEEKLKTNQFNAFALETELDNSKTLLIESL